VVAAIAATIEIVFALYFARTAIRIVRGIKRVWFV